MTNLGPLTTTYTPTGTDCQSSFIGANNDNQWFQYGQPTSTGACFPNSFEPFEGYYYSPGVCPSGYTPACSAGVGTSTTQATCCPIGYQCRTSVGDRSLGGDPFACASTYPTDTYLTLDYWKFSTVTDSSSTSIETTSSLTTISAGGGIVALEAYGPIIRRSEGDPEWVSSTTTTHVSTLASTADPTVTSASTSEPTTTATDSGNLTQSTSGLSTSAKAGIGVGVSLGALSVIGCIVAAFIIGKRRRAQMAAPTSSTFHAPPGAKSVPGQVAEMGPGQGAETATGLEASWEEAPRHELDEQRRHLHEMGSTYPSERPAELHG